MKAPTSASAPGKVILLGEHAVVYGRPAIAVPVWESTATATVTELSSARSTAAAPAPGGYIHAHDTDEIIELATAPADHPLALVARLALAQAGIVDTPRWRVDVRSEIPMASGLGSGAAVSTALVRAIFAHLGHAATPDIVSEIVYESEKVHHGTPSGIDNTVIAYGLPVWFVRGQEPQIFEPGGSFTLTIADSGVASPTRETVGDVRRAHSADPVRLDAIFDRIAEIAVRARQVIEAGDAAALGPLFDANQRALEELGVSSAALQRLIGAARGAGALGAKLSGGGRGGNMIALVEPERASAVADALRAAGARRVLTTVLAPASGS